LASASPTVSKGLESSAPVEKSRGPRHKPAPRGNSGPSLGHVSGEVRVYPAGPAAAGSGINYVMADSTNVRDNCGRCALRDERLASMEDAVATLDVALYGKLGRIQGGGGVNSHLAALGLLRLMAGWLKNVSKALGTTAVHASESFWIADDVIKMVERGPRPKNKFPKPQAPSVPGADYDSSQGVKSRAGTRSRAVQTEHVKCKDVAVGGSPLGAADAGVQASRAPRETPMCEGPGPGLKVPGSHASPQGCQGRGQGGAGGGTPRAGSREQAHADGGCNLRQRSSWGISHGYCGRWRTSLPRAWGLPDKEKEKEEEKERRRAA